MTITGPVADKPGREAGGHARAAALSPERRREIALKAVTARWAKSAMPQVADQLVKLSSGERLVAILEGSATRVGTMRHALQVGACSARELGKAAGVPSKLVMALLKADIASGRVRVVRGRAVTLYELSTDYDAELQQRISEAARFLRSHGYEVAARSAA